MDEDEIEYLEQLNEYCRQQRLEEEWLYWRMKEYYRDNPYEGDSGYPENL
jgi:hypothetical protein